MSYPDTAGLGLGRGGLRSGRRGSCGGLGFFRNAFGRGRCWRSDVFLQRGLQIALHVGGRLLEFLDALAKALGEFGQLLGTEEQEDHGEDENKLPATKHSRKKRRVHVPVANSIKLCRNRGPVWDWAGRPGRWRTF